MKATGASEWQVLQVQEEKLPTEGKVPGKRTESPSRRTGSPEEANGKPQIGGLEIWGWLFR